MPDDVLAEQVAYYRRRAAEYDATSYGDLAWAATRIERIVSALRPAGSVLELACGTGLWTPALARHADTVVAVDSSPEAIAFAAPRVAGSDVTLEVADVFAYAPPQRVDVVFFSAWLSHVPDGRFDEFWARLAALLTDGGRVLFVDEHVDERGKETWVGDGTVERTLLDGSTFRIVKNYVDPERLTARLAGLGWTCAIARDGTDWVVGEARVTGREDLSRSG